MRVSSLPVLMWICPNIKHMSVWLVLSAAGLACVSAALTTSIVAWGAQSLDSGAPMAMCAVSAAGQVSLISNLNSSIGSGLPDCFAVLPGNDTAAVCTLNEQGANCIAVVSISNGTTLRVHCNPVLVIDNLVVDTTCASARSPVFYGVLSFCLSVQTP